MKSWLLVSATALLLVACGSDSGRPSRPVVQPAPPVTQPAPRPTPAPKPKPVWELNVDVQNEGHYWEPVRVDISKTKDGVPVPYTYSVPEGRVVETDTGILIYTTDRKGTFLMTVGNSKYAYTLGEPPVCEGHVEGAPPAGGWGGTKYDCQGRRVGGPNDKWYVYFGEDDTRIVEWEIVLVTNHKRGTDIIDKLNKVFEENFVYVRLVLAEHIQMDKPVPTGHDKGDIVLVMTDTRMAGVCGQAYIGQWFRYNDHALTAQVFCPDTKSAMHEIGHAVGLGHGPDIIGGLPGYGYTFPDFAHGSTELCGTVRDIMSYGPTGIFGSPYVKCSQVLRRGPHSSWGPDDVTGTPESATGHAINLVRYDVALIHNEFAK